MKKCISKPFMVLMALVVYFQTSVLVAQNEKNLVPREDYGKFESGNRVQFSDDNSWAALNVSNNDKDQHLKFKNLSTGEEFTINNASSLNFSSDGIWATYKVVLPGKKEKELKKKKKTVPNKMALFNLTTRDTVFFEDVNSSAFSGDSKHIALYRVKDSQNTVIVRTLKNASDISFGNVKEYSWQPKGQLLAFITKTKDKNGNGVQLYNPSLNTLKALDSDATEYKNMYWAEDNDDLCVIKEIKDEDFETNTNVFLLWNDLAGKKPTFHSFKQEKFPAFQEDWYIVPNGVQISKNGDRVFFNIFNRYKKAEKKSSDSTAVKQDSTTTKRWYDEAPALEIWNSKDELVITQQKVSSGKGIDQPRKAVWNVKSNTFNLLEDDSVESVSIKKDESKFIGYDQEPYRFESLFGRPSFDLYLVDAEKTSKEFLIKDISSYYDLNPAGEYFVYLKNDQLYLFDVANKTSRNLTENIDAEFINHHNDHPVPQQPAYGFGGWSKDGNSFLLYSEFDVWQFHTNKKQVVKITDGKPNNIIYRVYYSNYWGPKEFDSKEPLLFTMNGKLSKESGFAKGKLGSSIATLVYEPASINISGQSEDESVLAFSKSRYDQPISYFISNNSFEKPTKAFQLNPFFNDYKWGNAELVNYTNALGNLAQGILYYPADYVKGNKYPMITYIYETLSAGLNNFISPSETSYYNSTVWSQNGYFVFNPDIEFEAGNPGVSSARTLEKAVAAVIEKGDVDAKKVGLIGHSWGGYQAGFVPTQTDVFAAAVAGAGLTNLISMNLAITPAFRGSPENNHFEIGQERMVVAPWLAPDKYVANSSVMQVDKLNTPILFEVGDNDMNVNWRQGVEYYNAARRANKDFILLVYAKEGHGLREPKNQADYQHRILQWFGHYLKGEEAADWIKEGIPYNQQERELKQWNKK